MTNSAKQIAVIGTLTRDTTIYADGTKTQNLGGIHYTLSSLASLLEGEARILPVANVGADALGDILASLHRFGIDTSCLAEVPEANNHVFLTYHNAEDRDEVLHGMVRPVSLAQCRRILDVDWLLVNMTSGKDIELSTLEDFRREFKAPIQLDIHSLTLGFESDGRRVLEKPPDWERWVRCADWLQLNEVEARLLGDGAEPGEFAEELLRRGPRGVLVTLGSQGCLAVYRQEGQILRRSLAPVYKPDPAYPTGCGDVFGASFAFAMLKGCDPGMAVRIANLVASRKACFESNAELANLRRHLGAALGQVLPQVG